MWFKITILLTVLSLFQCRTDICSDVRTLSLLRRSTYDFSVKLLYNVALDSKSDFVFSPLATWLQLASLAEGALKKTFREIRAVTKHSTLKCRKIKWKTMINDMNSHLKKDLKLRNVMIIDKYFKVKGEFLKNVERLKNFDVLVYDFLNNAKTANGTNEFISSETGGKISKIVYPENFDGTSLVSVGAIYFTSKWKTAFENTSQKDFITESGRRVPVDMMSAVGFFNTTSINSIRAKILELPCANERMSMLVFMPFDERNILELFYSLQRIRIKSIFTMFKRKGPQYLNVELPKFKMNYEFDNIPELIYDMGARRMFYPHAAEFKGISDAPLYASVMTQVSTIDINEKGIEASSVTVQNLYRNSSNDTDFIANRPFIYMLVDKELELMLFTGMFSKSDTVFDYK